MNLLALISHVLFIVREECCLPCETIQKKLENSNVNRNAVVDFYSTFIRLLFGIDVVSCFLSVIPLKLVSTTQQNWNEDYHRIIFGQTVEDLLRRLTDRFKQEVPAEKKRHRIFERVSKTYYLALIYKISILVWKCRMGRLFLKWNFLFMVCTLSVDMLLSPLNCLKVVLFVQQYLGKNASLVQCT